MLVLHQTNQIGYGQATPQIGLQSFGVPSPEQFGQHGMGIQGSTIQQFQQIVTQLEQAESRHAQMLQQIQAEEQRATQQLQYLRQLCNQLVQQAQPQVQAQSFSTFPRV